MSEEQHYCHGSLLEQRKALVFDGSGERGARGQERGTGAFSWPLETTSQASLRHHPHGEMPTCV